jgi:hypothetical protein
MEAAEAAEAKNANKLLLAGGDIYEICESCHSQYMDFDAWEEWQVTVNVPCPRFRRESCH